MAHVTDLALQRGRPETAIHTESFVAPARSDLVNKPFEVLLRKSGRRLQVPADKSLLTVLQENKVPAAVAVCTQGLCGSCAMPVAEGEVEHRDIVLSQKDRDAGIMTACCSRAAGERIALDL